MKPDRAALLAALVIVLLGAASPEAKLSASGSATGSRPSEWGPEKNGVRTGLTPRDEGFVLGTPMMFRLAIENLGTREVHIETATVALNSSMAIEQSDGTDVPYIAGSIQTGFGSRVVGPGKRIVLFEDLDIADQYLLTSPGTYKVRFRGRGADRVGQIAIPASNVVTIRVADGPVKRSRLLARTLFDGVHPSGWRLEWIKEGDMFLIGGLWVGGTTLSLTRDGRTHFTIWVTGSPSDLVTAKPEKREGSPERLGRSSWGEVYVWPATLSAEELSMIRKLTATALNIESDR